MSVPYIDERNLVGAYDVPVEHLPNSQINGLDYLAFPQGYSGVGTGTGSGIFGNIDLNPLNWGKSLFGSPMDLNDFSLKMLGKPVSALDASERMQLGGLFQQDQQNKMFSSMRGLGWAGIGLQGFGLARDWIRGNEELKLAKDNLNFMKEQANRNWVATARNYNDKAAATNYSRNAFAGGDISPRMRYIDESKIG